MIHNENIVYNVPTGESFIARKYVFHIISIMSHHTLITLLHHPYLRNNIMETDELRSIMELISKSGSLQVHHFLESGEQTRVQISN